MGTDDTNTGQKSTHGFLNLGIYYHPREEPRSGGSFGPRRLEWISTVLNSIRTRSKFVVSNFDLQGSIDSILKESLL